MNLQIDKTTVCLISSTFVCSCTFFRWHYQLIETINIYGLKRNFACHHCAGNRSQRFKQFSFADPRSTQLRKKKVQQSGNIQCVISQSVMLQRKACTPTCTLSYQWMYQQANRQKTNRSTRYFPCKPDRRNQLPGSRSIRAGWSYIETHSDDEGAWLRSEGSLIPWSYRSMNRPVDFEAMLKLKIRGIAGDLSLDRTFRKRRSTGWSWYLGTTSSTEIKFWWWLESTF